MNLPTLPMTREEFWRQYWDRIAVPVLGYVLDFPVPGAGCWLWTGTKGSHGYGVVKIQGQVNLVHRLVHDIFNEELEPEAHVLHSCNTKECVNPLHLRSGTPRENAEDAAEDYEWLTPVDVFMRGGH